MLLCTWVQTVQRVLLFVPGCCVAAEWTEVRAPPRLLLTPRARCKRRQQASNRTGRWAAPSAYPTYWQAHFVTGLHPTCQWPFHLVTGACMWAAACIPLLLTQGGGSALLTPAAMHACAWPQQPAICARQQPSFPAQPACISVEDIVLLPPCCLSHCHACCPVLYRCT